jgi:hypothetical protein
MVLIVVECLLRFRIYVYCLICAKHKQRSDYWFLYNVRVLCALRIWICQIILCMLYCRCYILICIFHSGCFELVFRLIVGMLYLWHVGLFLDLSFWTDWLLFLPVGYDTWRLPISFCVEQLGSVVFGVADSVFWLLISFLAYGWCG